MQDIDVITGEIVDLAVKLHVRIGPGLLESVYETLLERQLRERGLIVERQKLVAFEFDGITFREGLRVDLFVENQIIVEIKSVEKLTAIHSKQVLTYLRLLELPVGLLLNFGAGYMREGLHRIVNRYRPSSSSPLRINQRATQPETENPDAPTRSSNDTGESDSASPAAPRK